MSNFEYLRHNKKFSSEYDLEEKAWECIIDENANVEKIVLDEINIIELNKKTATYQGGSDKLLLKGGKLSFTLALL